MPIQKIRSPHCCLLYTSDAADDLLCVDLGGRRIIKKKKDELNPITIYRSQSRQATSTDCMTDHATIERHKR